MYGGPYSEDGSSPRDVQTVSNPLQVVDSELANRNPWSTLNPKTTARTMEEWESVVEALEWGVRDSADLMNSFGQTDMLPLQNKCAPTPSFIRLIETVLEGGLLAAAQNFVNARAEYNRYPTQVAVDHLRLRQIALDFLCNEVVANRDVLNRVRFGVVSINADVHHAAFGFQDPFLSSSIGDIHDLFRRLCDECIQLWHVERDNPIHESGELDILGVTKRICAFYRLVEGRCVPEREPIGTQASNKASRIKQPHARPSHKYNRRRRVLVAALCVAVVLSISVVVITVISTSDSLRYVAAGLSALCAIVSCLSTVFVATAANPVTGSGDVSSTPPSQLIRTVELAAYFGGIAAAAERLCVEAVKGPPARNSPSVSLNDAGESVVPSHIVNEHMVVIGVDRDLMVVLWNDEAARVSGYAPEDVVGQHVLSILEEGPVAAISGILSGGLANTFPLDTVRIIGKRQQLLHLRATATKTSSSGGGPAAIVCGVVLDDFYRSTHSYVISCLSVQLHHDLGELSKAIGNPTEAETRLSVCNSVAQLSTWSSINRVSSALSQWDRTSVEELLVHITRRHFHRLDISIHRKGLPDVFIASTRVVEGALQTVLKTCLGRLKVDIAFSHLADDCEGFLMVSISGEGPAAVVPDVCTTLSEVGGVALLSTRGAFLRQWSAHLSLSGSRTSAVSHTDVVVHRLDEDDVSPAIHMRIPIRQARGIVRTNSSGSAMSAFTAGGGASVMSAGSQLQSDYITILLYEPHSLHRNIFCDVMWANGQAVMLVDTRDRMVKVLQSGTVRIDAVVVSADDQEGRSILPELTDIVNSESQLVVVASETRGHTGELVEKCFGGTGKSKQVLHLLKPFKRTLLVSLMRRAVLKKNARLSAAKDLEEQRRLFSTHKSAPWKKGRCLGSGTSGDVYEAENLLTHGTMAVKVINTSTYDEERIGNLTKEIKFMCALDHPNIVHYFHCEKSEDTLLLFMELCDDQMRSYIARKGGRLTLSEACSITRQLVGALVYLHEQKVVHRDIKPENLLLSSGKVKLSDFGTAAEVIGHGNLTQTAGTFRFMAPEVFSGDMYGTSCDVWSVGVMFLELIGLKVTFLEGMDFLAMTDFYSNLKPTDIVELPKELTGDVLDFVRMCLTVDHTTRPPARTLQHHPLLVAEMPEVYVCHVLEGDHAEGSRSSRGSMLIPGFGNQPESSAASGSDLIDFCAM